MENIKTMSDVDLCKKHSYWWGQAMFHQCAEGVAYQRERDSGIRAEDECEKIEREFDERNIDFCWRTIKGKNTDHLAHAYTKDGKDIYVS